MGEIRKNPYYVVGYIILKVQLFDEKDINLG